jgi:hypothetical protein
MWPVFGLLAVIFWWMLIHTDYDTVGLKGMRREQATGAVTSHAANGMATSSLSPFASLEEPVGSDDDPDLAAYNARLAELAAKGPKTWRHREEVVVRRPQ